MANFYSCKINRPATLKRHRTLNAAKKAAGDFGFVYDSENDSVFQIFKMSNNSLSKFNVATQPEKCITSGFDMRKVVNEAVGTIYG